MVVCTDDSAPVRRSRQGSRERRPSRYRLHMTVEALLMKRAEALEAELAQSDARLEQLASAINEQGLAVPGSRKQPRPSPLLSAEREERRTKRQPLRSWSRFFGDWSRSGCWRKPTG